MICQNCGKEIPDNRKFCTFCGSNIAVEPEQPKESPAAAPADNASQAGPEVSAETPETPAAETQPDPELKKTAAPKKQKPKRPPLTKQQLVKKTLVWSLGGLVVMVFFIIMGTLFGNRGPGSTHPKYSIINDNITDTPAKTHVVQNYLVSGEFDREWLETILKKIYHRQLTRSGFRHHKFPNAVTIYMFTSLEHYESGRDQWIAMLDQDPDKEFSISINETALAVRNSPPEEKFGFTEEQRVGVWRELVAAEMRARRDADIAFPVSMTASLEAGERYPLYENTPLVRELDGDEKQTVSAGSEILIVKTLDRNGAVWYFVDAFSESGMREGRGWISAKALEKQLGRIFEANLEDNIALYNKLLGEYRAELLDKYNITPEQADDITAEGMRKNWPYPVVE